MKTPNATEDPCHFFHSMFIQDDIILKAVTEVFPPL